MKNNCDGCDVPLQPTAELYVRPYDCTFCPRCAESRQNSSPNFGGEFRVLPRREISENLTHNSQSSDATKRGWLVFALSCAVWTVVAFAGTLTIYHLYRSTESPMRFVTTMGWEFSQILTYAPLTPFVFAFATKFPILREKWAKDTALYLAAGLAFSVAHIALRTA